jgi:hypothetical protein
MVAPDNFVRLVKIGMLVNHMKNNNAPSSNFNSRKNNDDIKAYWIANLRVRNICNVAGLDALPV